MTVFLVLIIFACLIGWAKENLWSENDTQNFAQAARHGTRMRK